MPAPAHDRTPDKRKRSGDRTRGRPVTESGCANQPLNLGFLGLTIRQNAKMPSAATIPTPTLRPKAWESKLLEPCATAVGVGSGTATVGATVATDAEEAIGDATGEPLPTVKV